MHRPSGFILDVPVTLSPSIRGATLNEARKIARQFANDMSPTDGFVSVYSQTLPEGVAITAVGFESSDEDTIDKIDDLEGDEDGDISDGFYSTTLTANGPIIDSETYLEDWGAL